MLRINDMMMMNVSVMITMTMTMMMMNILMMMTMKMTMMMMNISMKMTMMMMKTSERGRTVAIQEK